MRDDDFPTPVSDPEAEGLPGVADDDSTAQDDVETGRVADGADPAALPLDRDDQPLAIDHFGTTAGEARDGESLDLKLDREVPDPALDAAATGPARLDDSIDDEDADATKNLPPVQTNADSPVSTLDMGIGGGNGTVGRLVEPDEGTGPDTEKDAIAYDAGAAGGAPSAEEAALHPIPDA
jgi:hypothetical protein